MRDLSGDDRARRLAGPGSIGRRRFLLAMVMSASMLLGGCGGCSEHPPTIIGGAGDGSSRKTPQGLLAIAIDNLDRQEDYPSLNWEGDYPIGEMLRQIVEQLNQWIRAQTPEDDWQLDPAVADMPPPFSELKVMQGLGELQFPRSDGLALREAVWLRNVSSWARGEQLDDLSRAKRLFDWTVRNIQLETAADYRIEQMPWESLFLGRGTVLERVWVFILLARQEGLDAALLALPDPDESGEGLPLPWAVGVLIGGEVYVFDPSLGLPVPAPDGIGLDETGQLEIRPATLGELADDDSLLRRLDLDAERPYPLTSSDLGRVFALVEASPVYLSRRMKLVESQLLGSRRMVITTSPSGQMARWKAAASIADSQLWIFPFVAHLHQESMTDEQRELRGLALLPFLVAYTSQGEDSGPMEPLPGEDADSYKRVSGSLRRRTGDAPLNKARILHLKGEFTGPQGASGYYQDARPSTEELANLAEQYYSWAREVNRRLPQADRLTEEELKEMAAEQATFNAAMLHRAKQDASYWLGLMNLDMALIAQQQGNGQAAVERCEVAVDYLRRATLDASPGGPWTHGANYNLGRTYEALGELDDAIAQYAGDTESPSYFGNLLRARWLNQLRLKAGDESGTGE